MNYGVLRFLTSLLRGLAFVLYSAALLCVMFAFSDSYPALIMLGAAMGVLVLGVAIHANAEALALVINVADHVANASYRLDRIADAAHKTAEATAKLAATIPTPKH